jgi:hypothetical protein
MRLESIAVTAGHRPGTARLTGTVTYDTGTPSREELWYEVGDRCREDLSTSGNPWLVSLLPLAMTLGEPLRLSVPVDQRLLDRCHQVMEIWKAWYPRLHLVPIEADTRASADSAGRTALFFSGGVDSFSSLLRNQAPDQTGYHTPVDDLIMIWGADVPLAQVEAFERMRQRYQPVAIAMGKRFIDIATNLRETRWGETDWARLSHGAFLASVGLSLERGYRRLLIASSVPISNRMGGWGSHPMVDPLFSTHRTQVVVDAAGESRERKVERVAESELALNHLRVCWRSGTDQNCGACHKCYRTMIALELCGRLGACPTFPVTTLDLARVSRLYFGDYRDYRIFRRLLAKAWLLDRHDIVRALDRAMRRSRRRGLVIDALRAWDGPGSTQARRILLRGSIVN